MKHVTRGVGILMQMADYPVSPEPGGSSPHSVGRDSADGSADVDGNGTSDVMVRIKLQMIVAILASAVLLVVARLLPEPPVVEVPLWWSDAVRSGLPGSAGEGCSRRSR